VRFSFLRRGAVAGAVVTLALVPALGVRVDLVGTATAQQPGVALPDRARLRSMASAPLRPRVHDEPPALPAELNPPDLTPRRPRLRVDGLTGDDAAARTLAQPGVAFATAYHTAPLPVGRDERATTLQVAFVDPDGFRLFTPRFTAEHEPAWLRLAQGEIALSHEAGQRLGVRPGQWIPVGDGRLMRVGAWLSTGRAQVGDAIVSGWAAGDLVPADSAKHLLVGLQRAGDTAVVAERIAAAGIGSPTVIPDIEPFRAWLIGDDPATVAAFEPFAFTSGRGGRIDIDPGWVQRNIVRAEVPLYGEVRCHRLLIEPLRAALNEVVAAGLAPALNVRDYGGCYLPRYIDWQEGRSLSMHAWGLAIDFNVSTNGLGRAPQLDLGVVEVFERHGFNWGGWWNRPDGMHFELGSLPAG
jgi:hypothetical protein